MSGTIVPAKEVGGDLYDFFVRDGYLFFCIGDVSGKGVPAALVMSVTRSLFRTVCAHEKSPQRIVSTMNESMAEMNDNNMFVTFFLGVLDLSDGHLRYCNAGHNAPVFLGSEEAGFVDVVPNISLGVLPGMQFQEQDIRLTPGEGIFLYTDGLTEAENSDHGQFGTQRMLEVIRGSAEVKADALVESMAAAVKAHTCGCDPSDDLTMLVIRYTNPDSSAGWERHLTLRYISEIPRLARFVQIVSEHAGLDDARTMSLNLALEEAVSNVILYAYPAGTDGQVDVEAVVWEDRIDFTVSDSGIAFDPTAAPDPDLSVDVKDRPVGGLGIYLVKRIMDSVSYVREEGRNYLKMTKKR
jgi:sigma-B regulation protein RsbU (phosphoserine phosphatase)